jgi:hypothetical protein
MKLHVVSRSPRFSLPSSAWRLRRGAREGEPPGLAHGTRDRAPPKAAVVCSRSASGVDEGGVCVVKGRLLALGSMLVSQRLSPPV